MGIATALGVGLSWQATERVEAPRAAERRGPAGERRDGAEAAPSRRALLAATMANVGVAHEAAMRDGAAFAHNDEQGFELESRGGASTLTLADETSAVLRLRSVGRDHAEAVAAPTSTRTERNAIRMLRDDLVEWYLNGPLGLEQGFELSERPAGEGALHVAVGVEGLVPTLAEGYVSLRDAAGHEKLRYSDLFAYDAEGDDVPARLAVVDGSIVLEVDDRDARYPLVIDPLITSQQARVDNPEAAKSGQYGATMASALAASVSWVVVGAPYDDRAASDAGAAYVYARNAANNGWDFVARLAASDASAGMHFGKAVTLGSASASQVVFYVGAPDRASGGKVYTYTFDAATRAQVSTASFAAPSPAAGDEFGAALSASRVNGSRVLVGAPGVDAQAGAFYAFTSTGTLEQGPITGIDTAAGDRFGGSMPPRWSGNVAVIGATHDDASAAVADAGSVYFFLRSASLPTTWTQESKLLPATSAANAHFGSAIYELTSGSAQYLVGEPDRANGVVYRAARTNGVTVVAATITAADGQAGDRFGASLGYDFTASVGYLLVGAPGVDPSAALTDAGAAYSYTLDGSYNATFVTRFVGATAGENAGRSVGALSISSTLAGVYGVPGDDAAGTDAGAARSRLLTAPGTVESSLSPINVANAAFGRAVAIDGNTLAVGLPLDDDAGPNAGAVEIYTRSGTTWTHQAKILPPSGTGQLYGGSVALEGDTLVFGTRSGAQNRAFVASRSGSTWSAPAELLPTGVVAGDAFGASVAISSGTIAVGAPGRDGSGTDRGAIFVFTGGGTSYTQSAELTALPPGNGIDSSSEFLGRAVALQGTRLVAGLPGRNGIMNAPDRGGFVIYQQTGGTFQELAAVTGPSTNEGFGEAVAIDGDRIAVGAPGHLLGGSAVTSGSVRTYAYDGSQWVFDATLTLSGGAVGDDFGASLALESDVLVVGAPGRANGAATTAGTAIPFLRSSAGWTAQTALVPPAADVTSGDDYGRSVAIDAWTLAVGAPGSDVDATGAGVAYVHLVSKSNGVACSATSDCASGFCVDGVCCDTACGGGSADDCQACATALGAAVDGTCGSVTNGTVCSPADPGNACDAADTCFDGTCLAVVKPNGTSCGGAPNASGCDLQDVCTSGVCTPKTVADGTACGGAPTGICDAQDTCAAGQCVAKLVAAGTVCRSAVDAECDLPEVCNGSSPACPFDVAVADGTGCGPNPTEACDAKDQCFSGTCQPMVVGSGTPCRAARGECDVAESCDGVSASCPKDGFVADGTLCGNGPASGLCDLDDVCSAGTCLVQVKEMGKSCRASTGSCDQEEVCDGAAASCPPDLNTCCSVDADCSDGNVCTAESCDQGVCVAKGPIPSCCTLAADCDDGDACTTDACSQHACMHTAIAGCGLDAGVPDAGTADDAGTGTMDGGMTGADAGVASDASVDDASVGDASTADAGTTPKHGSGGCDVGGGSSGSLVAFLWLALAVLAVRRRKEVVR
ncbi:MAG: hypothetical protein U0230_17295 [Polyangiales bacterium]